MTTTFLSLTAFSATVVGIVFFILFKAAWRKTGVALVLTFILVASLVCEVVGFRLLIN